LQEGKQTAQGAAEEDDVIARVDGAGEGGFVGVEIGEDAREEGFGLGRGALGGSFGVAVELEELGEQGENECEGELRELVSCEVRRLGVPRVRGVRDRATETRK
jgi:hypothetical protein